MGVGRKRKHNKHLPAGVTLEHGAYYFRGRDRKRIRLGKTLGEAMARWAELAAPPAGSLKTMRAAFERYQLEVMPNKAKATQRSQTPMFPVLVKVFGHMHPAAIRPRHGYAFLAKRSPQTKVGAIKEFNLASHVLTKCVEWGVIDENPFWQVRKKEYMPEDRERYATDEEYAAVYSIAPERIQIAMDLAVLTGLRRSGILGLTLDAITDDGLLVRKPGKKTKGLLFEWSDELLAVIERAKRLEPRVRRPLLCTRNGKPYSGDGFSSIWQRTIKKALERKLISERFTFHDLRAKSATDEEELETASQRLGHTSTATTRRVYVRKASRVTPLKRSGEKSKQ